MFPIRDNIPGRTTPVVTWALIAANAAVFLFELLLPEQQLVRLIYLFGIVPRHFTQPEWANGHGFPAGNYWAFLTSMFLHGGWLHIIANMWTLWIFGNNVEDRMGRVRFLTFYLVCGAASGVIHMVTNAQSPVPALGASGAIAGVLAAYFVLYPSANVLCVVPIFFYPLFIEIPAFLFILVWFWSQFFSGTLSLMAPSQAAGIAWWAHIGGFVTGLVIHRIFVIRPRRRGPETV